MLVEMGSTRSSVPLWSSPCFAQFWLAVLRDPKVWSLTTGVSTHGKWACSRPISKFQTHLWMWMIQEEWTTDSFFLKMEAHACEVAGTGSSATTHRGYTEHHSGKGGLGLPWTQVQQRTSLSQTAEGASHSILRMAFHTPVVNCPPGPSCEPITDPLEEGPTAQL